MEAVHRCADMLSIDLLETRAQEFPSPPPRQPTCFSKLTTRQLPETRGQDYGLEYDGKNYDPKAIVGSAIKRGQAGKKNEKICSRADRLAAFAASHGRDARYPGCIV